MGLGITVRWTEEDTGKAKDLIKQGLTYREVGDALGRSKESIAFRNRMYWKIPIQYDPLKYNIKGVSTTKSTKGVSKTRIPCTKCNKLTFMRGGVCHKCSKEYADSFKYTVECSTCKSTFLTYSHSKKNCDSCIQIRRLSDKIKKTTNVKEDKVSNAFNYISSVVMNKDANNLYSGREVSLFKYVNEIIGNYKCFECGYYEPKIMEAHHIVPFSTSKDSSFSNLTLLCPNCHTKVHKKLMQVTTNHINVEELLDNLKDLLCKDSIFLNRVYNRYIKRKYSSKQYLQ